MEIGIREILELAGVIIAAIVGWFAKRQFSPK